MAPSNALHACHTGRMCGDRVRVKGRQATPKIVRIGKTTSQLRYAHTLDANNAETCINGIRPHVGDCVTTG